MESRQTEYEAVEMAQTDRRMGDDGGGKGDGVRVMWGDMGVDVGIDKNKQPLLDPSSRVSKIIKPKTSGNLKSKHNSSLHNFFNGDNSKHIQLILK